MSSWRRSDVEPGTLFRGADGRVWTVVGIADEPTVIVRPVERGVQADEDQFHVIASPLFVKSFPERLTPERPS